MASRSTDGKLSEHLLSTPQMTLLLIIKYLLIITLLQNVADDNVIFAEDDYIFADRDTFAVYHQTFDDHHIFLILILVYGSLRTP